MVKTVNVDHDWKQSPIIIKKNDKLVLIHREHTVS